ncbi:MAG: DUF6232 family protein [Cyanobacteriota bacterium]|nr:DUF6232 family protein [Cyanobacteriota bacterium]
MALNSVLQDNNTTTIEQAQLIYITKKTVRFGADVYQFRNVAGFGLAEVKTANLIPLKVILALFAFGCLLAIVPGARSWGIVAVLLAVGAVFLNSSQPKKYGLKLYINSGDSKVFISSHLAGIKQVITQLYEFMESNTEESYVINIDQSRASIGVGYAENFLTH